MALGHPGASPGIVGFITHYPGWWWWWWWGGHVRNDHVGPLCVCGLFTVCVLLLITEVAEMWR